MIKATSKREVEMARILATAILAIGLALAGSRLAGAEVGEVKLALQNGSNYLPLLVMQNQKLVEKHLASRGLAGTTVTWAKLAGPSAMINSFLAGAVHFSGQGVPSTALIWDRTKTGIGAKAVSAMVASDIWLMTRKSQLNP